MPDVMLEPGRSPSGRIYSRIKELSANAVLPQPGALSLEESQSIEEAEESEASAPGSPVVDQLSEELQQALDQWAAGSLKRMALEAQQNLTEVLLSWEPEPKKSEEENFAALRETVRRYNEALTAQGGSLQITRPLEEALLEALSKWLEQMMAQLLRLLGPEGSTDGVKQLLEKLFRQITGASPSKGRVAAQATELLQRAAGRRMPLQGKPHLSEEGVLYRRGAGGALLDRDYSGQAVKARERETRTLEPAQRRDLEMEPMAQMKGAAVVTRRGAMQSLPDLKIVQELRFVENFAKSVSMQPVLPSAKELPFVSEERLGLEVGLLWLKGEAAAREPGVTPHTAALIRQATEQRTSNFIYEAGYAFQEAARAYPPGVCPNLWREDIFRVREELVRRYRQTKDPQRSLLETIAYAVELFREKQEKGKYRTWLRYLPGRGLFLDQSGWEDIKQVWQNLCRSWERFIQDMGSRYLPSFREAAALQSLWAMLLPPQKKAEEGNASFWSLGGWLATAFASAAVVYAIWSAVSALGRIAAVTAALVSFGAAFLLFRKSRKR